MSDQLNQFGIIQNLQMSPYSPNQFLDWDFFCRFLQQDSSTILIVCIINQVIQRAHISVLKYELGMSIIKQVNTYSYQEEVCSSQYYVLSEQILNKVQLVSVVLARARCSRHVIFCLTMCNRKQDLVLFFFKGGYTTFHEASAFVREDNNQWWASVYILPVHHCSLELLKPCNTARTICLNCGV